MRFGFGERFSDLGVNFTLQRLLTVLVPLTDELQMLTQTLNWVTERKVLSLVGGSVDRGVI